jgi:hypothetical protein
MKFIITENQINRYKRRTNFISEVVELYISQLKNKKNNSEYCSKSFATFYNGVISSSTFDIINRDQDDSFEGLNYMEYDQIREFVKTYIDNIWKEKLFEVYKKYCSIEYDPNDDHTENYDDIWGPDGPPPLPRI